MKILYLVKFTALAFILWIINVALAHLMQIGFERVGLMIVFLSVIYLLFTLIYVVISRFLEKKDYITGYVSLLSLKLMAILIAAYLLLGPDKIENRYEALFFLADYFIFLIFDITWKVKWINKNA